MTNVSNILRKVGPQFNKLDGNTPVIDALAIMEAENLNFIIVTKNGDYAGLFTEKDYAQKVILMRRKPDLTTIKDVMANNLPSVDSRDTSQTCMIMMTAYKTFYLPVFDDFEFLGIITMNDLMNEAILQNEIVEETERIF